MCSYCVLEEFKAEINVCFIAELVQGMSRLDVSSGP